MEHYLNKDTQLCISLAARPGNFGTRFHNFLYRELGLNFVYKAFSTENIRDALIGMRALGIRGSAISMPFKETCMQYLDSLDPSAINIGAVNTILNESGQLRGYNTDYTSISKLIDIYSLAEVKDFVVYGSGGMAKAILAALKDAGIKNGVIVSRNKATGNDLAKKYDYFWQAEMDDLHPELVVNASPIGMSGGQDNNSLSFPTHVIEKCRFVMESVAIPVETPLVNFATMLKKTVITGAEITTWQALEQFALYTGVRPSQEQIESAMNFARNG